jgi:hypothetical protein
MIFWIVELHIVMIVTIGERKRTIIVVVTG